MSEKRIASIGRATFGAPQRCPECGGKLLPCFGETTGDDGIRRPFLDYTTAQCEDCREYFKTDDDTPGVDGSTM